VIKKEMDKIKVAFEFCAHQNKFDKDRLPGM
jgi:hypothetical protein